VWILVESFHVADVFDVPDVVLADGDISFTLTPMVYNATATYNTPAFAAAMTKLFGSVAAAPPLSDVMWDTLESMLNNTAMPLQTWDVVQQDHGVLQQLQLNHTSSDMMALKILAPLVLHDRAPEYIQDRRRTLRLAFAFPTPAIGNTLAAAGNVSQQTALLSRSYSHFTPNTYTHTYTHSSSACWPHTWAPKCTRRTPL
jgi:hypothetical protein